MISKCFEKNLLVLVYILSPSLMGVFISFIVFSFLFFHVEARNANCQSIKCSHARSPFWFQGNHLNHFSHPNFELRCQENITTFHFPGYGDLVVKSISYDIKKLSLLDPKNCVHEVFLNLDLSPTPFRYYYVTKNYTYLNCSATIPSSLEQVPCLSSSDHYHVYVVEESSSFSSAVPRFCKAVKTVAIPFAYSSHISDDSFGLGLTWNSAGSEDGAGKGSTHMAYGKVLGFSTICIMVVVTVISSLKAHHSKKFGKQIEDDDVVEKLVIAN